MKTTKFKARQIVWIVGTRSKKIIATAPIGTLGPIDEPQRNLRFFGYHEDSTGFGLADGRFVIHCEQFYNDPQTGQPVPEKGNAPFNVEIKLNGNYYRTDGPFPACEDPNDTEEFNILVEGLPRGHFTFTISDSSIPPLDARGISDWHIGSPPRATLNCRTNLLPGMSANVNFEFGLTTAYGRVAEAGIINIPDATIVSIELSGRNDQGDPVELLEPGKEYHYRGVLVFSDGSPSVYTEDMTFMIPTLPLIVVLPATNIISI